MKLSLVAFCILVLTGCAQGRLDVLNDKGEVIGECSANFYGHFYGAKDSVNYLLNLCAQEHINKGRTISDNSILSSDYTLPTPPIGRDWNKKLAKQQFKLNKISEKELGYVLAAIEFRYMQDVKQLTDKLASQQINKKEYELQMAIAQRNFYGN